MICAPVRRENRPTGAQTMLCLTCTMISSVDLACYGVSRAKDWVSVDCGTKTNTLDSIEHTPSNYWLIDPVLSLPM